MAAHAYSDTTTDDLWEALEKSSGHAMRKIAPDWTQQPGFPLVTASAQPDGQRIILRQEKFTLDDTHLSSAAWQIPVVWQTINTGGKQLRRTLFLGRSPAYLRVPRGSAVDLNAGNTGYYRVQYSPSLFQRLAKSLESLRPTDRVGLLGDTWALAQAERVPAGEYMDLMQASHSDTNLAVTEQIEESLDTLLLLERGQPGLEAFKAFERSMLQAQFARIGWSAKPGESSGDVLRRENVITTLGELNDPLIVAEARARFAEYVKNPTSLSPGLTGPVFYVTGRYADQATYDRIHAYALATTSTESKDKFYRALGGALDPALAQQTLEMTLTDELDPVMTPELLRDVGEAGEQPALVWEFFQQHASALVAKQDPLTRAVFVPTLFDSFTDAPRAAELEAYAKASLPADAAPKVAQAAAVIRLNAALKQRLLPQVDRWVASH